MDEVYWEANAVILGQRNKYHEDFDGVCEPTDGTDTQVSNVCLTQDYQRYDVAGNILLNGGFETYAGVGNATDWNNWTEVRVDVTGGVFGANTTSQHSGLACCAWESAFPAVGPLEAYITSDFIAINPLITHILTYWHKIGWDNKPINGKISFYDAGPTLLGEFVWSDIPITTWTQVVKTIYPIDIPIGTTQLTVEFHSAELFPTINNDKFLDDVVLRAGSLVGQCLFPIESHSGRYLPGASIAMSAYAPIDSSLSLEGIVVHDTLGAIANVNTISVADFKNPGTNWIQVLLLDEKWSVLSIPNTHISESSNTEHLLQSLSMFTGVDFDDTRDFWTDYIIIVPIDQSFLLATDMSGISHLIIDCRSSFRAPLVSLDGTLDTATMLNSNSWVGDNDFIADVNGLNLVWLAIYHPSIAQTSRCIQDIKLKYSPLYLLVPEE